MSKEDPQSSSRLSVERGRPLGFDPAAALEAAMSTFWQFGYDGVSTPRLEAVLGLARSSIANTFGKKRDLLVACLDRYLAITDDSLIAPLRNPTTPGLAACVRFFDDLAALKATAPGCFGCLMINTATEFGSSDEDISERFQRYRGGLHAGFASALGRAAGDGASPPEHAVEVLVALALAMNIQARAGDTAGVSSTLTCARAAVAQWNCGR